MTYNVFSGTLNPTHFTSLLTCVCAECLVSQFTGYGILTNQNCCFILPLSVLLLDQCEYYLCALHCCPVIMLWHSCKPRKC